MGNQTEKTRRLNMEEKRNLQKLLFSDIETAAEKFAAGRRVDRDRLKEKLVAAASPEVLRLVDSFKAATKEVARVESELSKCGYHLTGYPQRDLTVQEYKEQPKELVAFDEETARTTKRMADLKRDFTLRLFAGGEEARELFLTLAREIADVLG